MNLVLRLLLIALYNRHMQHETVTAQLGAQRSDVSVKRDVEKYYTTSRERLVSHTTQTSCILDFVADRSVVKYKFLITTLFKKKSSYVTCVNIFPGS